MATGRRRSRDRSRRRCDGPDFAGIGGVWDNGSDTDERGGLMAAMKPRTGDGPMEAVKEGRLIIVRVPLEGGGRLVVSVNDAEAKELYEVLGAVVSA